MFLSSTRAGHLISYCPTLSAPKFATLSGLILVESGRNFFAI